MTDRPTYWDVPENERHALTESEIEYYCRRELADSGYVYPNPPVVLPEDPPPVETTTFYQPQIDSYNKLDLAFETMAEAVTFLRLSCVKVEREWRADVNYSKPLAGMSIEPVELPTEEQIDAVKQSLSEAKKNREANQESRKEFDKAVSECDEIIERVRSDHRERLSHEYSLQCIRDTYAEFLKIADGEALIATRFLLKRHNREEAVEALGSQLAFEVQTVDVEEAE